MATKSDKSVDNSPSDLLKKQAYAAWEALQPIRQTWDDKEKALLAKTSDSFSGNVVRAKVTDAALSTLAFERQARVSAQLPTGKVYPTGKADEGKAKLANIILQRYIIPNAGRDNDMLTTLRQWGVYASVYGSMPMFYDYCVEDDYIGPYCKLVDPRMFLPQPGKNSIKESDWCMVSTIQSVTFLEKILERDKTTWDTKEIAKVLKQAKKAKPARYNDAEKDSVTSQDRYNKELAEGEIELITKYESGDKGRWITFAPDYDGAILRDIENPHKSGRIPVVIRHCFPLMNSIFGLGDFERGMKIQKAKDSIIGLFLEGAKNRIYPPLKIDQSKVTPSSIKYQAGAKWLVSDMQNGVQPMNFGGGSLDEFQGTFSALQSMLMNQFGTTDTSLSSEQSGNPAFGKTPEALKQMGQRENARDTWDRFMHEQATEELYEGMLNLLAVKMEKPINLTIFEEEIRQIADQYEDVLEIAGDYGRLTVAKKLINTEKGFTYMIDSNTSMKQDEDAQMQSLSMTWELAHSSPTLIASLQQAGMTYNEAEHFKAILIASGITDWERILPEGLQEGMAQPQDPMAQGLPQDPMQDPNMQHPMMGDPGSSPMLQPPQPVNPQFEDPDVQAFAEAMFGQPGGM